jgi:hypothetical protein
MGNLVWRGNANTNFCKVFKLDRPGEHAKKQKYFEETAANLTQHFSAYLPGLFPRRRMFTPKNEEIKRSLSAIPLLD